MLKLFLASLLPLLLALPLLLVFADDAPPRRDVAEVAAPPVAVIALGTAADADVLLATADPRPTLP